MAKDTAVPIVTMVVPGKEYGRSGYHNFFWGRHYRREWTTPVHVNNFYLDTAAGGLVPYQEGGGRQTKTLRLRARSGSEYVLRSVNKDFGKALPEHMRGTFISRIAKDQVSIGHPFAAVTIVPMIEAAGIYHTNPVIVYVPVQDALGAYNKEYGNQLYLFEERPDDNESAAASFGYATNVIGSEKLLEHVYNDNDNRVDQVAFVRARLFDMFIGDWGRHPDNWRWAKFEDGKQNIYQPIPRDRDQAYSIFDGFYPSLAGKFYKSFQGFHPTIKKVGDWNAPGRPLDRLFLTGLERDVWISQATELQQVLTDSLIASSIRLMPEVQFAISGNGIIEKLKSRRDHLVKYANDYYEYLAKYTDLAGSQDRELFSIERMSDGATAVSIHKITKEGSVKQPPFYSRRFLDKETKEIRIYSLGGSDRVEVKGVPGSRIRIRVIDPDATDTIAFVSQYYHPHREERDKRLHRNVKIYTGRKYEYDTAHEKKFDLSIRPIITATRYKVFDRDPIKLFPRTGLKLLAGITYNMQPWRKADYEITHHVSVNYGFVRSSFNTGYVGRFGRLLGRWDLLLKARLDAPAVENFFGIGNNTAYAVQTRNYYRTFSTRVYGSIGVDRNFDKYHHAEAFVFYQSVKVKPESDHYISQPGAVDPSVFNQKHFAGIESGYAFLKADNPLYPTSGVGFNLGAAYIRNLQDADRDFVKMLASAAVYVPLSKQFSLAVRAGGGTISGIADYYYLNTLGGGGTGEMRGYDRERFYGKHTFHLNNDLRWLFNTRNFLFNGKAGLLGFYDIGRVWQPGESSTLWHDSYGVGVVLIPFNRYVLSATYGISTEDKYVHFKAGFFF
ncbi:MAG: BamA/TamA family outer membrane protein [Chitinophagaceae bacterium]